MKCPYCGAENPEASKFCRSCGRDLEETRAQKSARSMLRGVSRLLIIEIAAVAVLVIGGALVYANIILPRATERQRALSREREAADGLLQACEDYRREVADAYLNLEYMEAEVVDYGVEVDRRDGASKPLVTVRLANNGPYPITKINGAITCIEFIDRLNERRNPLLLFDDRTDYEFQPIYPRGERERGFFVVDCISDLHGRYLREIGLDVREVELKWDVKPQFGFEEPPPQCIEY